MTFVELVANHMINALLLKRLKKFSFTIYFKAFQIHRYKMYCFPRKKRGDGTLNQKSCKLVYIIQFVLIKTLTYIYMSRAK